MKNTDIKIAALCPCNAGLTSVNYSPKNKSKSAAAKSAPTRKNDTGAMPWSAFGDWYWI